ncbi:RpiB/LacA/LacB family sugar-phosphate isomerase [Legionella longbeachae]|uniref:Putative ribose/galactose isomerase n=1 Tax=Legionella longbeachae serogroup 1 (strain NSW150) TaxID=661367 RepID=D3HSP1_LEGLN|nr:RpiB/LacA/LacB family sugar-phosphate isomerase [Legionella longbeachae]VEE02425.1 ribose/galactose isomerase [Legionella oakridgensis]HBD7398085.1 RpiB/LacA/LacB family sugar-phosphate isomerase [Legionella pneumophila]ARB91296.1 RpiB/LacA/LacB family sugar-phosphate isomerase [Legionella longbeachae]ARM32280.1 RpiB/LacA/LacB family sugar-phosphate isomerase [Legionella longbeachae]EEZ94934.1 sugar-phosphate isomerase RpiB/LacA/LacB family protein [Legionella longbeachae D-4968]
MKIAVCSDELYPVNDFVIQEVEHLGHQVILFGALKSRHTESWVETARVAAEAIKSGMCDEGIFFCWTGTGISIVANKIPGIRAALCTDAQTTRGARVWNSANVLALSNRLLTQDLAKEILDAWFNTSLNDSNEKIIEEIGFIERKYR